MRTSLLFAVVLLVLLPSSLWSQPAISVEKPLSKVVTWPGTGPEPLRTVLGGEPAGGGACQIQLCDPSIFCFGGTNSACVLQTFPDVQWRICIQSTRYGTVSTQSSKAYSIGPVDVRTLPSGAFKRVVHEAGPAEVFTPYHLGSPRFYDTQFLDWENWRRNVSQADAGQKGVLLTLSQDSLPTIVAECRDRGPAWLCKQDTQAVRRGQELLLWGVLDTGNYDFIEEFGFRDDGALSFRVGATGYNNPGQPDDGHMHDVLWRLDLDIDGAAFDTAKLFRHIEPMPSPPQAVDQEVPFNSGVEGSALWSPTRFTSVVVEDSATNANGNARGYELHPLRSGTARHFAPSELWTQTDFTVTAFSGAEAHGWAEPWQTPDDYLFPYANGESLINNDVVLWYLASTHHDPIDEDRDSSLEWGVTLTHWFGFTVEPHDFFDFNPLGGPARCGN